MRSHKHLKIDMNFKLKWYSVWNSHRWPLPEHCPGPGQVHRKLTMRKVLPYALLVRGLHMLFFSTWRFSFGAESAAVSASTPQARGGFGFYRRCPPSNMQLEAFVNLLEYPHVDHVWAVARASTRCSTTMQINNWYTNEVPSEPLLSGCVALISTPPLLLAPCCVTGGLHAGFGMLELFGRALCMSRLGGLACH